MPALLPTTFCARITWLGRVPDDDSPGIRAAAVQALDLGWNGPGGERHSGLTRPSCSRMTRQHPKGTEIRNVRQLSIVSAEELAEIAALIRLPRLDPELLGATMVVEGLADFSHLPPSSRLQGDNGVTLVVDMQNRPCHLPAREIEQDHLGHGKPFRGAAAGKRGVTAWVERPGRLVLGDALRLHVPDQRAWAHIDAARTG